MLKGLIKWLRIMGFSTLSYEDLQKNTTTYDIEPSAIFVTASKSHRFNFSPENIVLLTSDDLARQLHELNSRFGIFNSLNLFSICLNCNIPIEVVSKDSILDQVPEKVRLNIKRFWYCPSCHQVYWKGGHVERMLEKLKQLGIPIDFKNDF
jgi:uncharacterized protein with PIN domain